MLNDIEACLVDRSDPRATRARARDAKLFEALHGFANRAAVHAVAFRQVPFGREAFAAAVLTAQNIVAKLGRDGRTAGTRLHFC